MFIELAHYTIFFAITAIGLQALILSPTLWSKGSAIAIKLGFRGATFGTFLLLFSFCILMSAYVAKDFSLAIVFETFSSQESGLYALAAFCSSREGFFFILILFLAIFSMIGFSKKDLATYQERGRYLFATSGLIFILLILMQTTANPFARIPDPPMEGIGLGTEWTRPYKTIQTLCSFAAYALLVITFIKMVSMCSKGWRFVTSALRTSLTAFVLLTCSLGIDLLTHFFMTDSKFLGLWSPSSSLQFAILVLTIGQILMLYFCAYSRSFSGFAIFFSLCSTVLFTADVFASEYRLFALSQNEAYFPNPIIALAATAVITSFLLFFSSSLANKPLHEKPFALLARETFGGLAAACCLSAGLSIGMLSLLPSLFMFFPDLPLRLLLPLFKKVFFWHFLAFAVLLTIAFRRISGGKGWVKPKKKLFFIFWGIVLIAGFVCRHLYPHSGDMIIWTLPALLLFWTVLDYLNFSFPTSFGKFLNTLKTAPLSTYGFFACSLGFFIFSAALSASILNNTEEKRTVEIESVIEIDPFTVAIETLSAKTTNSPAQYRLLPSPETSSKHIIGESVFQWQNKNLSAKLIQSDAMTIAVLQIEQVNENNLSLYLTTYPALRLAGSSLFLFSFGLILLALSWKRRQIQ